MNRPKMKDIAELCHVSIKTVSRVLNDPENVKPETRERIIRVMNEQQYQVNLLARGLKQKKTNIIIVFIDKHREKYWGLWHTQMLQSIFKEGKALGYKIIASPSSAKGHLDDETDGFHLLSNKMADGAILLDNAEGDVRIEFLNKNKVPYVLVGQTDDESVCWVDLDNSKTGALGCEYLIKKGYKRIAFLLGQEQFHVNKLRADGFEQVAIKSNIEYKLEYNVDSMEAAYETTKRLQASKRYDALFISGSERAIGAYKALNELGLKIPDEVAILGIDNIPLCNYLYPTMSIMDQRCGKFAETIIKKLDDLIKGRNDVCQKHILHENRIIEREST